MTAAGLGNRSIVPWRAAAVNHFVLDAESPQREQPTGSPQREQGALPFALVGEDTNPNQNSAQLRELRGYESEPWSSRSRRGS